MRTLFSDSLCFSFGFLVFPKSFQVFSTFAYQFLPINHLSQARVLADHKVSTETAQCCQGRQLYDGCRGVGSLTTTGREDGASGI